MRFWRLGAFLPSKARGNWLHMTNTSRLAALCGAVGLALIAITGTAAADGYEVAAPAAADEGRKFTYSFNIGATSDYVFRGISQTDNDPTIQGGIDLGYGILYAGWWASGLDFEAGLNDAKVEMDWYGGIRPTWGKATFDLGVIYYTYPGSGPILPLVTYPDLNYVELKAGVSGEVVKNLTAAPPSIGRPTTSPRPAACGHSKASPPTPSIRLVCSLRPSRARSAIRPVRTIPTTHGTASAITGTTTRASL